MSKPINPSNRVTGRPCPVDGTTERYKSGKCCACQARHQREWNAGRIHNEPKLREVPQRRMPETKRERPICDPTIGAAFPAGRARLMAGR